MSYRGHWVCQQGLWPGKPLSSHNIFFLETFELLYQWHVFLMRGIRLHMYGHCEHVGPLSMLGGENCWTLPKYVWKSWTNTALSSQVKAKYLHRMSQLCLDTLGTLCEIFHILNKYFLCYRSEISFPSYKSFLQEVPKLPFSKECRFLKHSWV